MSKRSVKSLVWHLWRVARERWHEAMRTRLSMSLPLEGIVFVAVTLLIGTAAMNTSAQLLFLVFSMMCAFWVLSAVLATSSLRGLEVSRVAPRLAEARRPVRIRLRLRNRKRFNTSFSLRVSDSLEGDVGIGAAFFSTVPRRGEASQEYECLFPRRGVYRFRSLTIATRFPFGLIERTITRREPAEMLVLPATIAIDRLLRSARVDLGEREVHAKGRGMGLYGIREYREGESARDIHWKVSARSGRLMVREYESEERRRASVILDNRLPANAGPEALEELERAIILANSLLGYLAEREHQVELLTASGKVAFGSGPQHLLRCRRALALLEPEPPTASPPHAHVLEADTVQFHVQRRGDPPVGPEAIAVTTGQFAEELKQAVQGAPETGPTPRPEDLQVA